MTTVGVDALKPWRVDALHFPSYNYHYPAFKRRQLCHYYECYKSRPPPDFRRVDAERKWQMCECFKRENVAEPGTTKREHEVRQLLQNQDDNKKLLELTEPPAVPAPAKPDFLARPRLSQKEYERWRFDTTPVMTTEARAEWAQFLSRCPERFENIKLPMIDSETGGQLQLYYDGGFALRFLRPHLTRGMGMESWRTRPFGVKPGPADNSPFRPIKFINKQ